MTTLQVSDTSSHRLGQMENAADALRTSKQLRSVFEAVYRGKKQPKTIGDLKSLTGIQSIVRLLQLIKKLDTVRLIEGKREKNQTVCYKIDLISLEKRRILNMAKDKRKLDEFRKQNRPGTSSSRFVVVRVPMNRLRAYPITIDDIDSFARVRKVNPNALGKVQMSEKKFKEGIRKILGDKWKQLDWGGEIDDMYSTRLKFKGKRLSTAFAFKGQATKGELVPKKMGKNADQIQRLFRSPARIFVVQYHGVIRESIIEQMKTFAGLKSFSESEPVYFMVIDGQDSARLVKAYPRYFI